ncbi:MAG: PDZ domain-containing protein [Deltaproteobacteria bacterium]|nr:PDZ domain-containing protein [Deltaproteobacteria bacterium]
MRCAFRWLDLMGVGAAALLIALAVSAVVDAAVEPLFFVPKLSSPAPNPHVTLDEIQMARVFGISPRAPQPLAPAPAPPMAHLRGAVLSNHAAWSWALLDEGRGAVPLLPGDSLGDCVLESVESDRAIVRCGDTLHSVGLDGPIAAARSEREPDVVATLTHVERNRLAADPNLWLTSARVLPVLKNGRISGVTALWVQPGGPAAALGLQVGDVIHSVDGIDVGNLDALAAHLPALLTASHAVVSLERAGSTRNIALELRD